MEGDLRPLVQSHGKLNNYMMKCIKTWFNSQIETLKCHVCCFCFTSLLHAHLEEEKNDNLEVYIGFIHEKYGMLSTLDITTLIGYFTCEKH